MLFTESAFFGLLLITLTAYYAVKSANLQILLLIVASFVFYAWHDPALLILLLTSIAINTLLSSLVFGNQGRARSAYFVLAILINLTILCLFKYANLIASSAGFILSGAAVAYAAAIPLPIGISFYTFEGISLMTDTYRGVYRPRSDGKERSTWEHLRNTSLFIAFFPHLIAGPILKANQFMPQIGLKRLSDINFDRAVKALIIGYFLKSVLADNLAEHTGYMNFYTYMPSLNLLWMLFSYSCQIFADFAGYSSIAIGIAHLFGYDLPANFNWPYISQSFSEFWRRWHISLSTWLRDYLYFPLGGNRGGAMRTRANLLIVMILGGLWHGAAWNYALWGLWHGGALVLERPFLASRFYRARNCLMQAVRTLLVFSVVSIGWLLFRMRSFADVVGYLHEMRKNISTTPDLNEIFVMTLLCLPVILLHIATVFRERGDIIPRPVIVGAYGMMIFFLLTSSGPAHVFIYFQF